MTSTSEKSPMSGTFSSTRLMVSPKRRADGTGTRLRARAVPPSAGPRVRTAKPERAPRSKNHATEIRQNRRQISVEARGFRAVDHAMVVRQRERQRETRHELLA